MSKIPEAAREFVNSTPTADDYATIGRIALQQSALEYQIESLTWYYMGDTDKGHIATAQLSINAKIDMLETLVEWTEPEDAVADAIAWAIQAFNILRESRNIIVHGFNFRADRDAGKLIIERRTKKLVMDAFQVYELASKTLHRVSWEQIQLSEFLWKLDCRLRARPKRVLGPRKRPPAEPLRLPPRPALPETLTPLPLEAAKSARRLRQERAAKEAKEAKRGRREKKPRRKD